MKREVYIFILLAIAILVIAAGMWMYFKPHPSVKDARPEFSLTASELIDAFTIDEAAATRMYGGKVLEVSGKLEEIFLRDSAMVLQMSDEDRIAGISCYLSGGRHELYAALQPGETIRVKGRCNGMLMDVVLDKCILIAEGQ